MSKIAIILVLPLEYNTSSMLRCKSVINALCELGHSVKCYCPYPDTNSKYYSNDYVKNPKLKVFRFGNKKNSIHQPKVDEVKSLKTVVKAFGLKLFHKIDVFGSTLLYLPERKRISKSISDNDYDFLISFSDPMPAHMIGKYCKRHNRNIRYIQQWGDPLASDTISKIAQPVWIRKIIEKKLIKDADRICYVSPFTCQEQKRLFPRYASKMVFLPTPSLSYYDSTPENDKICLGYFGSYNSVARNIIPFYEAAKQNKDVYFYIIGDSDINLESTENITIINRVSPNELDEYMRKINVIVCLMNLKGNQIPGKVYHDASSSKDILLIKDGEYGTEIQNFLSKYNHYTFVNNDINSICEAIKKYHDDGIPNRKPVEDFKAVTVARKLISC